jgi:hypothetical protein
MKKHLLAAVAALAIGGSALAQENPTANKGRLIGLLGEAGRKCDASYNPDAMIHTAALVLTSLVRHHEVISKYQADVWIDQGGQKFDDTAARRGIVFACDGAYRALTETEVILADEQEIER